MSHVFDNLTFKVDLPGGQSRLLEAILFVCQKCERAERFGKVKLNKMLWRADFEAFERRGVPVTGRSYQRLAAGPAPVEMPPLLAEMVRDDLIRIDRSDFGGGFIEERPVALVDPSLRYFSPDDISYLNSSIIHYWNQTASRASALSHGVAWKSRSDLDPMPYESALLSNEKLSATAAERFGRLAKEKRWTSL